MIRMISEPCIILPSDVDCSRINGLWTGELSKFYSRQLASRVLMVYAPGNFPDSIPADLQVN